jgi:DNA-binding transcriptional MerR regulator
MVMAMGERTWRIGDVAVATGLTVRALHHYDQIGLVVPSERTDTGHRLYIEADLRRLYLVTALRQLGLPLGQVGKVLAADVAVRDVIDEQLQQVDRQIRNAKRLREQLLAARDAGGADNGPGLMTVIKLALDMRGYLSPEQIEAMRRRMTDLGVIAEHAVGVEMPSLYRDALAEMRAGTPASDRAVRRIVDRLDELSRLLRGSDEPAGTGSAGTGSAGTGVRQMWLDWARQHPDHDGGAEWGPLVAYLDEARAAR